MQGGAVSTAVAPTLPEAPDSVRRLDHGDEAFATVVLQLVHLAGGRLDARVFEPAALLLTKAGVLDGATITFGCDYELNVLSRELRRGYVHALDAGRLCSNGSEMWLEPAFADDAPQVEESAATTTRAILELPQAELERRARRLLLAE